MNDLIQNAVRCTNRSKATASVHLGEQTTFISQKPASQPGHIIAR
jgi:hypothetical protein